MNEREFEEQQRHREKILKAVDYYRNDRRFRMIIDSSVAEARHQLGKIDPDHAERDAHELAIMTAALAVTRVVHEDAELLATRAEVDQLRKMAIKTMELTAPAIFIQMPKAEGSADDDFTEFEKGERQALLHVRGFITQHGTKEADAFCAQRLYDIRMDARHRAKQAT